MAYIVSFIGAVLLGWWSLKAWKRKWIVDDTPTSKCRGVFVGRNEVIGSAQPLYEPIVTPFSQSHAVWWSWELERYQQNGKNSEWVTVEKRSTNAPFWIQDDTGRVLVRPRKATLEPRQTLCERIDGDFAPPYSRWQLRQWVLVGEDTTERAISMQDPDFAELPTSPHGWFSTTADTAGPLYGLSGKHRVTEKVICAGDPIYLLGTAAPRPDGPGLQFEGGEHDLFVSTKDEKQVSNSNKWSARLAGLGSLACSAFFVGMVTDAINDEPSWFAIGLVLGIELLLLFLIALMRNYNRQVEVKEQAAKAWSLIDVSLQRRHELIPNLVAVVQQYAAHEQQTQQLVTELRSVPAPPPTEELPSDQTLSGAESTDRGLRSAAQTTVALAEAYPDLKADTVFLDLQRRYVDAEESVATARHFYNDSIEMLRTRRQQFPGSLFARFVDVPSWNLFEADLADTVLPALALAPAAAPVLQPAPTPGDPSAGPPPAGPQGPAGPPSPPPGPPPAGPTGPSDPPSPPSGPPPGGAAF